MSNFVKIVANPETGLVITPSKNPEWGVIRVDSEQKSFANGIFSTGRRVAFIRGKIEDLEGAGFKAGQVLPGKIVKHESFVPHYEGQVAKTNPQTGTVVLTNGLPTYLKFDFVEDINACDIAPNVSQLAGSEELKNNLAAQTM
jgi:hypothetical protein